MPTWCRIATCSIKARVEEASPNTPPLALMTNTLPLYMRMYGAAPRSARTATEGSERSMTESTSVFGIRAASKVPETLASQEAIEHRHLHHHSIERFANDDAAWAVEHLVRDR